MYVCRDKEDATCTLAHTHTHTYLAHGFALPPGAGEPPKALVFPYESLDCSVVYPQETQIGTHTKIEVNAMSAGHRDGKDTRAVLWCTVCLRVRRSPSRTGTDVPEPMMPPSRPLLTPAIRPPIGHV